MKQDFNYAVTLHLDEAGTVKSFTVHPYRKGYYLQDVKNRKLRPQLRGIDTRPTAHAQGKGWLGKAYQPAANV